MTAAPQPGSLRAWVLATRPPTLAAAVVPVLVGSAVALGAGGFSLGPALAALVGAILIQVGTNFANDVFDFEKGADTAERLGPLRAAQAGLLSPGAIRRGMWVTFGLAVVVGLYLASVSHLGILLLGAVSIASGIAYTGGPYPLGYNGLGDVFVFLFFGFAAVCGTAFVQMGSIPESGWWSALGLGALSTNILVVNNLRDLPTDQVAGKRTVAVRFGRGFVLAEYVAMVAIALLTPVALLVRGLAGPPVLLPLLVTPLLGALVRQVFTRKGRALNPVLGGSAGALMAYGILLSIGLVAGSL